MLNLLVIAALATAASSAAYGFVVENEIRRTKENIEASAKKAEMIPEEMYLLEQKQKQALNKAIKDLIDSHTSIKLDDLDKDMWESK